MAITLKSGIDFLDASPKNNHEVQAKLITTKQIKKQFEIKEVDNKRKFEILNKNKVEQSQNKPPLPPPQNHNKTKEGVCFKKFFDTSKNFTLTFPY